MGFAPGAQVERGIFYAHAHGLHNFAAIIPKGAYGDLVQAAFQAAVSRAGDKIVDIENFDPSQHDHQAAVKALALKRDQIDALLLPEGGADLVTLATELRDAGIDNRHTHVIGTGLWDVQETGTSEFLRGGWYAASDPKARKNFLASYVKTYNHEPPRLATLAYDATALAALLAKQGGRLIATFLPIAMALRAWTGFFASRTRGLLREASPFWK